MKERPILFSATMVQAILAGRKSQTRRVIKDTGLYAVDATIHGGVKAKRERAALATQCPYGTVGDRLWVRETWTEVFCGIHDAGVWGNNEGPCGCGLFLYRASWGLKAGPQNSWRPSIHMPRKASRITLEIVNVRVQRVQEISEEDALAEGCQQTFTDHLGNIREPHGHNGGFHMLWDSINKARGFGWDINPWVWALTFWVLP